MYSLKIRNQKLAVFFVNMVLIYGLYPIICLTLLYSFNLVDSFFNLDNLKMQKNNENSKQVSLQKYLLLILKITIICF